MKTVQTTLWQLTYRRENPKQTKEMPLKEYDALRLSFGDRSKFIMSLLLEVVEDPNEEVAIRWMAVRFFVRGGTRMAYLGPHLSEEQKQYNRTIAEGNHFLHQVLRTSLPIDETAKRLRKWYEQNRDFYHFTPGFWEKVGLLFDTRFFRYFSRVLTLNFGTLRNDNTKLVIDEVTKRFKYSLTLSMIPLCVTFVLSLFFGMMMATNQNRGLDVSLNVCFLILFAIPIFVVAPFLIEKVALNHHFPFTDIPIPISGFTSPEWKYAQMNSRQRLFDVIQHICLPLLAILYGSLAASSRLSRTAFLEVLRQDYVRTARAKGLASRTILFKHVGRNAAITIVTAVAGSLGVVLGGSLIVETLFEINGFGKFFYDAVVNRDYNVIMFSALAGAFLTLVGYLVADLTYTFLDPRVTLE